MRGSRRKRTEPIPSGNGVCRTGKRKRRDDFGGAASREARTSSGAPRPRPREALPRPRPDDATTDRVVLQVINQVNRELGTTTAVITHNAAIAGMADRVVVLANGAVAEERINRRGAIAGWPHSHRRTCRIHEGVAARGRDLARRNPSRAGPFKKGCGREESAKNGSGAARSSGASSSGWARGATCSSRRGATRLCARARWWRRRFFASPSSR